MNNYSKRKGNVVLYELLQNHMNFTVQQGKQGLKQNCTSKKIDRAALYGARPLVHLGQDHLLCLAAALPRSQDKEFHITGHQRTFN